MSTPAPASPLIAIVDDDEDDLFFLRRALATQQEYAIKTFTNSEQALNFLRTLLAPGNSLPRAVFSDIRMPGLNGFELVETIRATPELNSIRIAMVSGSDLQEDQLQAKASGANAYFVKFPTKYELLGFIEAPWSPDSA